jgi:MFS family permease
MPSSISQTEPTLIDRYQAYRTRRFLKHERTYANALPAWRNRGRRRALVTGLALTFAFMFAVGVVCAFGVSWAPLLWLPACALFYPMWLALQIVSGRQGDAPQAALDEYEIEQRNSARSIGLTLTQNLMLIPIGYLIIGSVVTGGTDTDMAYAGGLMALTVLLIGGCTPAMILGWTRTDLPADDA